jgi:hypothetical protein
MHYLQKSFAEAFCDAFPDVDLDSVNVNNVQRIVWSVSQLSRRSSE